DHKNCTPPDGPRVTNAGDLFGLSQTINTYEVGNNFFLIDGSRDMFNLSFSDLPDEPVGVIWTIDLNNTSPVNENASYTHVVSSNNSWTSSPEAVSAHFNAGRAYDYFKETFNRESISGDGQNIISFVNVAQENGSSMGNAFWNGLGIYYGNGDNDFFSLGRGLDVAGHEMSHGVVQATANLEYFGESGAMNESFADIFGAMIDRDDWLIGEDVVRTTAFPSGALRNMMDPHNGASTNDFGRGWQPKHVNEKFNGPEDNNGVHINSGIPNHAFYLFANAIGRDKAERVFYRALTSYLTRSSGFSELRFAVIRSVQDLYGSTELNAARQAFDQVGITDESEGDFEEEIGENPGDDLLLVSDQSKSNLILFNIATGQAIFDPLTDIDQLSKPSVTDDGSRIVFTGSDNHIYLIDIDWAASPPTATVQRISYSPDWRNVVISKDGNRLALLDVSLSNEIVVLDIPSNSENIFELTNPTYTEGVETGDVLYADAMEFDISSNVLIYDAINRLNSNNSGTLEFWDIGFLEVWNADADTWALGRIDKLFGSLPEGISVGNPTFSKNSPFIIALDYLEGQNFSILGVNIETGDLNEIIPNATVGYPNYSRNDQFLVYDFDFLGYADLAILELNEDKISRVVNSDDILGPNLRWGVWFSNGDRLMSTPTHEIIDDPSVVKVSPNPTKDMIDIVIDLGNKTDDFKLIVFDNLGRQVKQQALSVSSGYNLQLNVNTWSPGMYVVQLIGSDSIYQTQFIKQ
ncbi:MAG: T9SS type A sorting domain-containing protein, partial [Saprospiraceae bacterium]|nr:T9SS type A sorting domain-containing protein [Saprospiraceae bacterium]